MLNVIRSEAIRIAQRRTLLIWFGLNRWASDPRSFVANARRA